MKGLLSKWFPPGKAYKPTLDQLAMTRMIDFPTLRAAGVRSFGTLEHALQFLASPPAGIHVYPPPRESAPPVAPARMNKNTKRK